MLVGAGNVVYDLGQSPSSGVGLAWSEEELNPHWVAEVLTSAE